MATIIAPVILPPMNAGIRNNFMNCWLSALLQMMAHLTEFNDQIAHILPFLVRDNIPPYNTNNSFIKLLSIIRVLHTILPQLRINGTQYNLTVAEYDTIMDGLLPNQLGHRFQDFDESFREFMVIVNAVLYLDFFHFDYLLEFDNTFTVNTIEALQSCNDPTVTYEVQPAQINPILTFYELNTGYVTSVQDLFTKAGEFTNKIDPRLINGINYCHNMHTYRTSPDSIFLLISFSNNRHKCIYPNPIIFVDKMILRDGRYIGNNIVPYIIDGAICYTGAHYYYISFDDNGTPLYEYDDDDVTNVTDFNKIYTEMVFASYLIYHGDPARIPDFRQLMDIQLASLRDRFTRLPIDIVKKKELLEKKKELEKKLGIHSDYLQIQYYEEMIKLTEPPNPITTINWNNINTQFYTYFFTPIPNYDVGKYIMKSVPHQELYDLFYIGDSFKEKYTGSIEVNTEHFKDINQINTKPIDKEVDIENIYNAREQLFSSSKKKPMKKYSMFYYTNEF